MTNLIYSSRASFSFIVFWELFRSFRLVLETRRLQGGTKKMAPFIVRLITSPNINRFLKFFHCENQETICNETVTTDPTTPQVCRYTTSWDVGWRTQAGDATDQLRDQPSTVTQMIFAVLEDWYHHIVLTHICN